jgi:predicted DNA-binding transcriptional regulator YafY
MPRGDSLLRQQRLIRILDERREIVVEPTARQLGCHPRTIYRDLAVLQQLGLPLYQEEEGRRVRWRLVDGPRRRLSITLSFSEMLALSAGRDLLAGLAGTFFHEAAISGLEKIRDALPRELLPRIDRSAAVVMSESRPAHDYRGHGDSARTLVQAIEANETVQIHYRKLEAKSHSGRDVDPYHLYIQSGALYLLGWCHRRKALRTFLLDRAARVTSTGRTFERRTDLDLSSILQGDLGPWSGRPVAIEIRFSPVVARLVAERKIHPSATAQWRNDGLLDVSLRCPLTPALERWLTGWGAEVQVLAPTRLADNIRARHAAALTHRREPTRSQRRPARRSNQVEKRPPETVPVTSEA